MLYEGGEIDAHLVSLAQMTNSSTTVQLRNAAPLLYSICWQQYFFIMNLKEIKEQIKNNVKWDSERPAITGGQQTGFCRAYPSILISEELDLKITVGYHRSVNKNKELAFTLFELALDELVR